MTRNKTTMWTLILGHCQEAVGRLRANGLLLVASLHYGWIMVHNANTRYLRVTVGIHLIGKMPRIMIMLRQKKKRTKENIGIIGYQDKYMREK